MVCHVNQRNVGIKEHTFSNEFTSLHTLEINHHNNITSLQAKSLLEKSHEMKLLTSSLFATIVALCNAAPLDRRCLGGVGGLGGYGLGGFGGLGGLGGWGCWIPFAAGGYGCGACYNNLGYANVNALSAGNSLCAVNQNSYLNGLCASQGCANTASNTAGASGIIA